VEWGCLVREGEILVFFVKSLAKEFDKKTNDRDFLDLEEDGLDGILFHSLDLFEERRSSLESPSQVDGDGRCIAAGKKTR
jgi:hypothetical protein